MTWGLLTQLTHRLAEYTVAPGPTDFGVRSSDWPPAHDVSRYGSLRWRLVPALAPDDAWERVTQDVRELHADAHISPKTATATTATAVGDE